MKTRTAASTLAVVALSFAALTGCSGSSQTVEEACAILNEDGQKMAADFENLDTEAAFTDLPKFGADMVKLMDDASKRVTNKEVKDAYSGVVKIIDDAFKDMGKGDFTALENMQGDMTSAAEKLSTLCPDMGSVNPLPF